MRILPVLISLLCGALLPAAAHSANQVVFPDSLARVLRAHKLPDASFGLVVQEAGSDIPLLSFNATVPRNPASAIKVITTLAALEELGPAYAWPTEVYVLGNVRGGTLEGDLGLKGYGDPYMVIEEFWKLVQTIRRQGIDTIKGDLVVDNTYFNVPYEDPGAFDHRPFHTYNTLPDAMLVNFRSVYFHFYPSARNGSVDIRLEPDLPNLHISNKLRASNGRCGGFQRGIGMDVAGNGNADTLTFHGSFPAACGYYAFSRAVLTPQTYAFGLFKTLWEESGGTITGTVRSETVATSRKRILNWRSRPLGEIIRLVNKHSNNVMTRQLLLTLGAEKHGAPGTPEKGIQAIREYLDERHIDHDSMILANGAGLSREERVSPRLLADILLYAHGIPYMPEFVSSLSIIGIDGTARNRFRMRKEAGHAHVKTGTIDHVSAIAGYVNAKSGRKFIVSGIINHPNVHHGPGEQLWNALIQWAYQQ